MPRRDLIAKVGSVPTQMRTISESSGEDRYPIAGKPAQFLRATRTFTTTSLLWKMARINHFAAEMFLSASFQQNDNLVWVIDGGVFRQNFDIYHLLPDPTSELARDLVWQKATRSMHGAAQGIFLRLSENAGDTKATLRSGRIRGLYEIEDQVNQAYRGHHQYDWIRPRRTWLDATCPVYIDFGDDLLAKLEIYDESGLPCIKLVSKRKFVRDAMTEDTVRAIASRF